MAVAAALAGLVGTATLASTAGAAPATLPLGPVANASEATYTAYYDAHTDTFVVTDVSDKAQAKALHVNYSGALASVKHAPLQYFVEGNAAPGQLSVLGSEPGESDYNPLWEEVVVHWSPGTTPVLLTSDNQINGLVKKHSLTITDAHIVLNAPVLQVHK